MNENNSSLEHTNPASRSDTLSAVGSRLHDLRAEDAVSREKLQAPPVKKNATSIFQAESLVHNVIDSQVESSDKANDEEPLSSHSLLSPAGSISSGSDNMLFVISAGSSNKEDKIADLKHSSITTEDKSKVSVDPSVDSQPRLPLLGVRNEPILPSIEPTVQPGAVAVDGPGRQDTWGARTHSGGSQSEAQEQDDMLPIAGMVVDEGPDVPIATARRDRWVFKICFGRQIHGAFVLAAAIIIVVVVIAVSLVVVRGSSDDGSLLTATTAPTASIMPSVQPSSFPSHSPSKMPSSFPTRTFAPSQFPSPSPSTENMLRVKNLLIPISGADALENPSSDQYRALEWLVLEDEYEMIHNSQIEQQIIQRYIVALIYFSTGGRSWREQLNFLSPVQECAWIGVGCEDMDAINTVTYITLADNLLAGTLVEEFGHLWNLRTVWMENNKLSGPIPDSLVSLTGLTWFAMSWNELTGSIPAALGNRSSLEVLGLAHNRLSGTVPTELGGLVSAGRIRLEGNSNLTGDVNFLCDLQNLTSLSVDCGGTLPKVNCSCCSDCYDHSTGQECSSDGFCCTPNWMMCI